MSDEKKGAVLTGEELVELERLEKEATPGPWFICEHDGAWVSYPESPKVQRVVGDFDGGAPDEQLALALRNAAPALLESARLARLAAELFERHGARMVQALVTQAFADGTGKPDSEARAALESTIAAFRKGAE